VTIKELCDNHGITLCVFPWTEASEKAGLKKDAVYVVRPDGYIGMIGLNN